VYVRVHVNSTAQDRNINKTHCFWWSSNTPIMDSMQTGWLVMVIGVLNMQTVAMSIIPETDHKFISKTNSVYKGNCSFRMNITEESFEIRRCVEILGE